MPRNRLLKKLSMGKADLNQSLTNEPQRIICFSGRNDSHRMALCRSGSGFALKEDGMQIDIQSRDFTLTESHFQGRGLRFKVRLSDVNGPQVAAARWPLLRQRMPGQATQVIPSRSVRLTRIDLPQALAAAWGEAANVRLEIICPRAQAETVLAHLQVRYFADYAMVAFLQDVEILRPEKF